MDRTEKRELVNRLAVLIAHLLKWQYQPDHRGPSWEVAMRNQRSALSRHMQDNPSLQPKLPEALEDADPDA